MSITLNASEYTSFKGEAYSLQPRVHFKLVALWWIRSNSQSILLLGGL